jgi:predicted nucleic acid-binding protein
MNVVLDACTLINLINGEVLQKIILLPRFIFNVSDNLLDQEILDQAQKLYIEVLLNDGHLKLLESNVTLSEFTNLKNEYDLGDGETECLALCKKNNLHFASDDFKARKCGVKELGEQRVVGSLFFLRESVANQVLTCDEAKNGFALMKSKGGYLPKVDEAYLCPPTLSSPITSTAIDF